MNLDIQTGPDFVFFKSGSIFFIKTDVDRQPCLNVYVTLYTCSILLASSYTTSDFKLSIFFCQEEGKKRILIGKIVLFYKKKTYGL